MKTIVDIRREEQVSKMILEAFDGCIASDLMYKDFVSMSEALAMQIIERLQ